MTGESDESPHEAFYYYKKDELQAVRSGQWKLHLQTGELYDLDADIGEQNDVAGQHADEVKRLHALAERCREDIGDGLTGADGANCRPCGRVDDPKWLTNYDPSHPYIVAMYDSQGRTRHRDEQVADPFPKYKGPIVGPQKAAQ
jgi:hypothetical protein